MINILLGLGKRLEKELEKLVPGSVKLRVVTPPQRKFSVWIGGSILASLSAGLETLKNIWLSIVIFWIVILNLIRLIKIKIKKIERIILSFIQGFTKHWITRHEYEEVGGNIVHRKCL